MLLKKVWKKSRSLGVSLLENEKEFSYGKKRTYSPGVHGNKRRRLIKSEYGLQIKEKNKFRFLFNFRDSQLKRIFKKIKFNQKKIVDMGSMIFQIAKSRMDRLVFEAKLAKTKRMAAQMISHGFFQVECKGKIKKISSPSFLLEPGNKIILKNKGGKWNDYFVSIFEHYKLNFKEIPKNILLVSNEEEGFISATYLEYPSEQDYKDFNRKINIPLVIDWYNKLV